VTYTSANVSSHTSSHHTTMSYRAHMWTIVGVLCCAGLSGPIWKREGRCENDPDFMELNCRYSCGICRCDHWARLCKDMLL
jgi:hypothetical protein